MHELPADRDGGDGLLLRQVLTRAVNEISRNVVDSSSADTMQCNVLNVKVIVIADVQKCRREIAAPAEDMSLFLVACCTNCWQVAQILHKWLHKCLAQKAVCSILGAAHYLVRSAC